MDSLPQTDRESLRPIALVVDPDQLMRWSLQSYLGRWYDVRAAATAGEGCTIIAEVPTGGVSLVIVADGLADAPADAVIREIRAHSPRARIVETVARSMRADGSGQPSPPYVRVLAKPFRLEALDAIAAR